MLHDILRWPELVIDEGAQRFAVRLNELVHDPVDLFSTDPTRSERRDIEDDILLVYQAEPLGIRSWDFDDLRVAFFANRALDHGVISCTTS
ncbi:MAG TPA: hypothetical protein VM450_04290 [Thermomicrobiales bacterium]|nr:hypothetical protein [Thermomicrobiales bacterium]